jgi:glyoxylase-like metal-dependent hydrolase (beta-lactamase superfamily II)
VAAFDDLGQGIYCIDALYLRPRVASIYLLRDGDQAALVDTGTCHSLENVLATLRALEIDPSQISYVIPTHVHLDHAGGASAMMNAFEQATLLIHPRGARHMADPQKLIDGTVAVYGQQKFDRLYGQIEPIDERRMHIVEDDERISLNRRELLFLDTPGHARHHFCIFDAASEGVFTGDTFGLSYDAMKDLPRGLLPTTPPSQFDPPALRESIARISALQPRRLYLTHFGAFTDPLAQVDSFHRWLDAYVDLCERLQPAGQTAEQELEAELTALAIDGLAPGEARERVAGSLKMDLHLNAQGLAHWWRSAHRG